MTKKNVLIINGHQKYEGISEGRLNDTFVKAASKYLIDGGFGVKLTITEDPYDITEELEKLVWANHIIFQCPVYWFSVPWVTKKYFDEVWSAGYTTVTCSGDGRTREDPTRRYGSGGLMQEKSYMLSLTYACPKMEFDDNEGFYDGKSIDDANISTHKIFQFCGLEKKQTYAIYNVHKSEYLDMDKELELFRSILKSNFIEQRT